MKKIILLALSLSVISLLLVVSRVNADEFPIPELGNCQNQRECHLFCEIPKNRAACWSFSVYGNKSTVLGDETTETTLAEIGITFPVAELGNCTDAQACKTYCSRAGNVTACRTFAQRFSKVHLNRLVQKAQEELGCTTAEECRAFCTDEANKDICLAFAKKYHLGGLIKDRVADAIRQELNCANRESCKALCALPENTDRCQTIAKRINPGLRTQGEKLIEEAKERLGCTSFNDCKAFCQNEANSEQCKNFGQAVSQRLKNADKQKGDCASNEECRKECEANPSKCPAFPKAPHPAVTPGAKPMSPTNATDAAKRSFNNKVIPTKPPIGTNQEMDRSLFTPPPLNIPDETQVF